MRPLLELRGGRQTPLLFGLEFERTCRYHRPLELWPPSCLQRGLPLQEWSQYAGCGAEDGEREERDLLFHPASPVFV